MMAQNLLPKSKFEFSEKEYWDKFFTSRGQKHFEWYGEFDELWPFMSKYMRKSDHILNIGCGNSTLSVSLYDAGMTRNSNIDISDVVIAQMSEKYNQDGMREGLTFMKMDMFETSFDDGKFDVVIDKGTLDAICVDQSESCLQSVSKMFTEVSRVLKPFGRYICVSLLQKHVLEVLINWFSNDSKNNWLIRIHRCHAAEVAKNSMTDDDQLVLPVFIIICTKLMPINETQFTKSSSSARFETCLNQDINSKAVKVETKEELIREIDSLQQFALIQYHIKNFKLTVDEDISLDLHSPLNATHPRYSLYFVDYSSRRNANKSNKCAVFIVPQGREVEWLFDTHEGRLELARQSGFMRIIVVHLNRNHSFSSLDEIKNELSTHILDFIPKKILKDQQVPFLSIGNDDIGKRTILWQGKSEWSGDYVVEEVLSQDQTQYRRLIFLDNQNIIQSEAKLIKNKNGKMMIDHEYLACAHHQVISCGMILLPTIKPSECYGLVMIGLGGGCLASYLQRNLNTKLNAINLDVVEIDDEMKKVGIKWFDLKTDSSNKSNSKNVRLNVHIDDGIAFIEKSLSSNKSYHSIILDVDSKSGESGVSCPPLAFVEVDLLKKVKQLLEPKCGVLLLNLVARNKTMKREVIDRIKNIFNHVYSHKIEDELNEIVFAFSSNQIPDWLKQESEHNFSKHNLYIPLLKDSYVHNYKKH